ncbi:PucR family transcriptional regulator [Nocardia sp. NPDC051570]|uniref:PucR family transcriptional regulator n=1 Tax=Nocardia sp. NPDC051570 TaxID=3364324 RepID=UPI0037A9B035
MTAAIPPPPREAALAARLRDRLPQFAEHILASGLGSTAPAADLPDNHFVEVLPAIHGCAHAFLHAVERGEPFPREAVAKYVAPVVERHAEDRLPLRLLLEAVHGSARTIVHEAVASSGPDGFDELVAFGDRLLDLLMHITTVTVESYAGVEQSIHHAEREARRALCAALLHGLPAEELAARADIALAQSYTVLVIHLYRNERPTPVADLLTRRRIRLLQTILDRFTGPTTLHTFDGTTGIALMPEGTTLSTIESATLPTELAELFGVPVFAAESAGTAREYLPQAAREATELAELARSLGRPTGTYRLDDLLLEYQLTRPGPARDRLAERIAPLLRSPHLIETLDAQLRHGADRKAAAAEIHVHPNTFSYRMRRIADLTGLDPADPNGSRLLAAALIVHRSYPISDGSAD